MKRLFLAIAFGLFLSIATVFGLTALKQQVQIEDGSIRGRFIGAWRLLWLEEPDAGGKVHRADCTGLLVYTPDGHMSVQVMYRNPQRGGQAGPVQYAQGGYEASFGTYQIDENAHIFTFHVEGAMLRSLTGKSFRAPSSSPASSSS